MPVVSRCRSSMWRRPRLAASHFGHALHGLLRSSPSTSQTRRWVLALRRGTPPRRFGHRIPPSTRRCPAKRVDGSIVRGEPKRTCRPVHRIGAHVGVGVNGAVRIEGRFQIARDVLKSPALKAHASGNVETMLTSRVPVSPQYPSICSSNSLPSFQTRRQQGASVRAQPTTVVVVGIQQLKRAEIRAITAPQSRVACRTSFPRCRS